MPRARDGNVLSRDGIAEMTEADFAGVASLWREAGFWPHAGENRRWLRAALARNPGLFLVCKHDGEVIGTVLGAWDGLRGWVYHLAVRQSHRGCGIGSQLLREAEKRLRAMGIFQVNLMVYDRSRRARDFYADRGYERSPVKTLRKRFGRSSRRPC